MLKTFKSKVALSLIVGVPLATVGLAQVALSGTAFTGNKGEMRLMDRDGVEIRGQLSETDRIWMTDNDGNPVEYAAGPAYSPRGTCGSCHDYTAINKAYHFMQGALPAGAQGNPGDTSGMGVSDLWSSENQGGTAYKYLSNAYGHLLSGGQYGAW